MRQINKCLHEYSEIQFISFQLQKPLENIATACTICYAAATFTGLYSSLASFCQQSFVSASLAAVYSIFCKHYYSRSSFCFLLLRFGHVGSKMERYINILACYKRYKLQDEKPCWTYGCPQKSLLFGDTVGIVFEMCLLKPAVLNCKGSHIMT